MTRLIGWLDQNCWLGWTRLVVWLVVGPGKKVSLQVNDLHLLNVTENLLDRSVGVLLEVVEQLLELNVQGGNGFEFGHVCLIPLEELVDERLVPFHDRVEEFAYGAVEVNDQVQLPHTAVELLDKPLVVVRYQVIDSRDQLEVLDVVPDRSASKELVDLPIDEFHGRLYPALGAVGRLLRLHQYEPVEEELVLQPDRSPRLLILTEPHPVLLYDAGYLVEVGVDVRAVLRLLVGLVLQASHLDDQLLDELLLLAREVGHKRLAYDPIEVHVLDVQLGVFLLEVRQDHQFEVVLLVHLVHRPTQLVLLLDLGEQGRDDPYHYRVTFVALVHRLGGLLLFHPYPEPLVYDVGDLNRLQVLLRHLDTLVHVEADVVKDLGQDVVNASHRVLTQLLVRPKVSQPDVVHQELQLRPDLLHHLLFVLIRRHLDDLLNHVAITELVHVLRQIHGVRLLIIRHFEYKKHVIGRRGCVTGRLSQQLDRLRRRYMTTSDCHGLVDQLSDFRWTLHDSVRIVAVVRVLVIVSGLSQSFKCYMTVSGLSRLSEC